MIPTIVKREITLGNEVVSYALQYKNVKNVNLRIKSDGSIYVSANKKVSVNDIEKFIVAKSDFVLHAIEKYKKINQIPLTKYFEEADIENVVLSICKSVYPYFEAKGVKYPHIKFRKMISRWGSCHPTRGILTFNTYLMYAPQRCIEYVVKHEFTHFLQANHSRKFYDELNLICPDWKECRSILKAVNIRHLYE